MKRATLQAVYSSGTSEHFTAHHHGIDKLGLARLLEEFANDQWIGEHYSEEQACDLLLDRFKKLVEVELEMVEVRVVD